MLRDGVPVEYRRQDGSIAGDHVRLIEFDNPDVNDWLAVNSSLSSKVQPATQMNTTILTIVTRK